MLLLLRRVYCRRNAIASPMYRCMHFLLFFAPHGIRHHQARGSPLIVELSLFDIAQNFVCLSELIKVLSRSWVIRVPIGVAGQNFLLKLCLNLLLCRRRRAAKHCIQVLWLSSFKNIIEPGHDGPRTRDADTRKLSVELRTRAASDVCALFVVSGPQAERIVGGAYFVCCDGRALVSCRTCCAAGIRAHRGRGTFRCSLHDSYVSRMLPSSPIRYALAMPLQFLMVVLKRRIEDLRSWNDDGLVALDDVPSLENSVYHLCSLGSFRRLCVCHSS